VNEQDLVELPSIELYFKKRQKGNDILILTGDVQPADERSSYEFCEQLLDEAQRLGVQLVITLGGIGLADVPKKPEVFCTGNSRELIRKFGKSIKLKEKLYGIVGPIIGVSGLLVGLAGKRKMPAVCLLSETLGHPAYLGIKGAREVVRVLNKKFSLGINLEDLDKEIKDIEAEILNKTQELGKASKSSALKKLQGRLPKDTSYIG
jgi:proteasome assembly chaperone (PAC2) family protein